jgi:hypothetical protein
MNLRPLLLGFLAGALAALGGPPAFGGRASLSWDASEQPSVARYGVHHGTGSRDYDAVTWVEDTAVELDGLPDCTDRFFAVRAYDAEGVPQGGYSREVRGWPRPRVSGVYPSVLEIGTVVDVTVVGANFRPGAAVEFDLPGFEAVSAEVRDCRRMVVRVRVPSTASEGDVPLHVVNPERTFGSFPIVTTLTLSAPGSVPSARRADVVEGAVPETP